MNCKCEYNYTFLDVLNLGDYFNTCGILQPKRELITYLDFKFHNFCMLCLRGVTEIEEEPKGVTKKYKQLEINNFLNQKNFIHFICSKCLDKKSK